MKFDASDKDDEINLQDWPQVKGMYMPDSIKTFKTGGKQCEHHQTAISSEVKCDEQHLCLVSLVRNFPFSFPRQEDV